VSGSLQPDGEYHKLVCLPSFLGKNVCESCVEDPQLVWMVYGLLAFLSRHKRTGVFPTEWYLHPEPRLFPLGCGPFTRGMRSAAVIETARLELAMALCFF
jgi:hypothetical protein